MPPVARAHVANRSRRPFEAAMIQGSSVNIGYAQLNMTNHQNNEATVQGRPSFGVYFTLERLVVY